MVCWNGSLRPHSGHSGKGSKLLKPHSIHLKLAIYKLTIVFHNPYAELKGTLERVFLLTIFNNTFSEVLCEVLCMGRDYKRWPVKRPCFSERYSLGEPASRWEFTARNLRDVEAINICPKTVCHETVFEDYVVSTLLQTMLRTQCSPQHFRSNPKMTPKTHSHAHQKYHRTSHWL